MLPFNKPKYIKASKRTIIKAYVLEAVGLASDEVIGVVIDNKVVMEQIHPTYSIALIPMTDQDIINSPKIYFQS